MRQAYATTDQNGKSPPLQNGSELSVTDTFQFIHGAVTNIFKRIQPNKTWALIADTLGLGEHAAKHRAANHRDYSVEEIMVLLHQENGDEILELLMADAMPKWWQGLQASLTLSKAYAAQAAWHQSVMALDKQSMDAPTRRQFKKVRNADRKLTAARAAQELATGLLLQNQDRSLAGPVAAPAVKAKIPAAGMRAGGRRG